MGDCMSKLEVREIGPISGETEVKLADGATAVGFGGGKVLKYDYQFQNTELTTTSTGWLETGFELNFTPESATSRIRITASLKVDSYQTNAIRSGKTYFSILRDNTTLIEIERGSYRNMNVSNEDRGLVGWLDFNYVDTIGATRTVNYKIQFRNQDTQTSIFNENQIGMFEIMEIQV